MKQYVLCIENRISGTSRDVVLNAIDSSHARILGESCCLRNVSENIVCLYSKEREPSDGSQYRS